MSNDEPRTLRDVALVASQRNGGARGRALGRIAEREGLTLSYTTVDDILEGRYKSRPKAATLDALVVLSGFTREQVYAAADMPMPLKPLRDDLPPDADLLTGPQRRVIVDAVRLFAQQNRSLAELTRKQDGPPTPATVTHIRPGPYDADLDQLPRDDEDPPPLTGGVTAEEAARREDTKGPSA